MRMILAPTFRTGTRLSFHRTSHVARMKEAVHVDFGGVYAIQLHFMSTTVSAGEKVEERKGHVTNRRRKRANKKEKAVQAAATNATGTHEHQEKEKKFNGPFPPNDLEAFISCLPGLERILSSELTRLNLEHKPSLNGVSLLSPTVKDLFLCHLFLGTASNILVPCGKSFSARGLPELRRKVALLPWQRLLLDDPKDPTSLHFHVRVSTTKSKLYHTAAIQDRVIAGIYEALGQRNIPNDFHYDKKKNEPDAIGSSNVGDSSPSPVVSLDVRIVRDQVQIQLNASPTPLHRRGYKLQTAKAPLREDLAYAMLWEAGWMKAGNHNNYPYKALLDPFCGSGTIAIEAAAAMAGLPPGRLQSAPFKGTKLANDEFWSQLVDTEVRAVSSVSDNFIVAASDRDAGAIKACQANAARAGVSNFMDIRQSAISSHPWLETPGEAPQPLLLATNPPFGGRISHPRNSSLVEGKQRRDAHLLPLYQRLNRCFNQWKDNGSTASAVVLSNSPLLVKKAGLSLDKRFRSTHGGMSVYAMVSNDKQ